jgi:inosine-uridine nucleoside N-ribohydrolase
MTPARVDVETAGDLTSGMTVADLRPGASPSRPINAKVCTEIRSDAFASFFEERTLK